MLVILPADKGRATVILKKEEYNTKIDTLLTDKDTYKQLDKDPTSKYKSKLINIIKEWKDNGSMSQKLYHRIYPTTDVVPRFYGLPKIHKVNAPLRPIVSGIGSITYNVAKFLAEVMGPLVGHNGHHIKNSGDLASKMEGLEVPPGQKLVSYDVKALFTSIPTNKAVEVIKIRLLEDKNLSDRCELSVEQVTTLLELCLNTTYFLYGGKFYQQMQGAAMGSPVSPIVANLYMEHFEIQALASAPNPPKFWYRYVDDTNTMIHEYFIDEFTNHINSIDAHIQFTIEPEMNGKLPFLDTCMHVLDDGSTKITVYRKPTHTDQYLNFLSHHPLEHKRSVVRTLLQRANTLVSNEEDRKQEIAHVKDALRANNYKEWALKVPKDKIKKAVDSDQQSNRKAKITVGIPYMQGMSEPLQRVFRAHGVNMYHKPVNTIRQQLVRPKDKLDKNKKCGTIYQVDCEQCEATYIGETARALGTRIKEHVSGNTNSAITDHTQTTGHRIRGDKVKILDQETNWHKRKVKEAIYIRRHAPKMNRDVGWDLPNIYFQILAHDPSGSCDQN